MFAFYSDLSKSLHKIQCQIDKSSTGPLTTLISCVPSTRAIYGILVLLMPGLVE